MSLIKCPTGCGRPRRGDHLMCPACWHQVPADLQRDVWTTWRRFERAGSDEAWEAYDFAREAAITAVR